MNLICGINPVVEALAAGTRQFDRLLIAKGVRNRRVADAIRQATELGVPLRFEGRHALDRIAGGVNHQGIIAVVSAKGVIDIEGLLKQAHDPGLLVVLDGIEDPRNLGAIVRTVEAAGADGVVMPERRSAPLSETVSRASAGALDHVRVARIGNLVQALERIKDAGYWVVGFDASGSDHWHAPDYRRPTALVFGSEGRGVRRLVRENCDQIVSLPLFGHVSSLNVSVTAGAALYEVIRQRGFVPSHVRPIPQRSAARVRQIVGPGVEDAEEDPGQIGPWPGGSDDGEADTGEHEPHTISVIDLHEEVGWARRTSVNVEGRRPRPPRRREEPRERAPEGKSERPPAADGEREGRSRRPGRRRRSGPRRSPRADAGAAGPAGESRGSGEAPPDGSSDTAGKSPSPGGRRRRRRRRRR